jgi:predicted phage-related endonuclease
MSSSLDVNKFEYSDAPQRSPEWIDLRAGKVTASRLKDWLAVSKRDSKPLQARKDYEAELAFEIEFGVPFTRFVTSAMEQGQLMEEFLKREYEKMQAFDGTKVIVRPVGCYYNNYFVASPDGEIDGDGLIECKWVYDKTYLDVLANGVPEEHMLQMQGQMWAADKKWCDYVVGNANTNTFTCMRVERDEEIINRIKESLETTRVNTILKTETVFEFSTVPQISSESQEF